MSWASRYFRNISAVFGCIILVIALQISGFAQSDVTWLDTEKQPSIERQDELVASEEYNKFLQSKRGFSAGLECVNKRVALRGPKPPASRYYKKGCWYNTKLGLLEKEGQYLIEPGSGVAASIKGNTHNTVHLVPTPDPDLFLELTEDAGAGSGYHMKFRPIDTIQFTRTTHSTGSVTLEHTRSAAASFRYDNSNNSSVHVDNEDIWYSDDTKWMLVYTQRGTVYRINLKTFSVLTIHVRDKPSGLLKGMATISDSGRYVALALTDTIYTNLYVIDAQSCADKESARAATANHTCAQRSFKTQLQAEIQPLSRVFLPNFYGEHTLGIYHQASPGGSYDKYIIQAPNTQASSWNYVAMGDSFSSGEGAYEYETGTDVPDNKCHLSRKSYPYLISQEVDLVSFHSVACSAARIEHVLHNEQYKLLGDLKKWHPGVLPQIDYFEQNKIKPDIITITMSGNDIGFSDRIKTCIFGPYCYAKYEERKEIANEIERHTKRLAATLATLRSKAAPSARIYMLGYPQIISSDPEAKCALNVRLNAQQRAMAHDLISYFNASIKAAAVKAGAVYVGTEGSLIGHRMCEASGSRIAVNGVTTGDDIGIGPLKFLGNESFHPNQLGNHLMKDTVLEQTDNLKKQPKAPKPDVEWPDAENYPFLKNAPRTTGEVYNLYHNPSKNPWYIAYPSHGIRIANDIIDIALLPHAWYKVVLHSEPVELGQVRSDGAGNINTVLDLPPGIEPGLHTIHIIGPDENGQTVDMYQHVYVGIKEGDFDGDGVSDQDEPCGVLEPAGVDEDQDGVDDGCDPIISDATILEVTPLPAKSTNNMTRMTPSSVQHAAKLQYQGNLPMQAQTAVSHNAIAHTNQSVLGENTIISQSINVSEPQANNESEDREVKISTKTNKQLLLVIAAGVIFTALMIMLYAKRSHGKEK